MKTIVVNTLWAFARSTRENISVSSASSASMSLLTWINPITWRKFGKIVQHRQSRDDVCQTAPLMQWNDRSFAKAGHA
jgi:hypothetical protein